MIRAKGSLQVRVQRQQAFKSLEVLILCERGYLTADLPPPFAGPQMDEKGECFL
jgi:hypothetical protein